MWCRHLRRGHWRRTWSLVMWHLFPLYRGEWRDSGWRSTHWFCGPSLFCLIWSHPDISSSGFVPSSCKVMSISTSYKNIPFLTAQIQLTSSHPTVILLLPFSKEKTQAGQSRSLYWQRRNGIKHWNNWRESSNFMLEEQRNYSCGHLSGHLCLQYFPTSSQLWCGSPSSDLSQLTSNVYQGPVAQMADKRQKVLHVKQLLSISPASWRRGDILTAQVKSNNTWQTDFHQEKTILICHKKGKTSVATSVKWCPSVLFNPP